MIRYEVANLLQAGEDVVVHGVNARGAFGSGVAGAMAAAWPDARQSYVAAFAAGRIELGKVVWARLANGRVVGHAVTQPTYGRAGVHVSISALRSCMAEVAGAAAQGIPGVLPGFRSVAMPRIGAGLGGGDWREIESVIEQACSELDIVFYVLSPGELPGWRPQPPGSGGR